MTLPPICATSRHAPLNSLYQRFLAVEVEINENLEIKLSGAYLRSLGVGLGVGGAILAVAALVVWQHALEFGVVWMVTLVCQAGFGLWLLPRRVRGMRQKHNLTTPSQSVRSKDMRIYSLLMVVLVVGFGGGLGVAVHVLSREHHPSLDWGVFVVAVQSATFLAYGIGFLRCGRQADRTT